MIDELCHLGVLELARLYRRKELSPVEVVNHHLQRCERLNPELNAFLLILRESATRAGQAMEKLFQAGIDLGPLQGVPVSVKDIIRLRGTVTTAASRVLLEEQPDQRDAGVVRLLRQAGAIIIGKTNLHEFATGDPGPGRPFRPGSESPMRRLPPGQFKQRGRRRSCCGFGSHCPGNGYRWLGQDSGLPMRG